MSKRISKEYETFLELEHWKSLKKIVRAEEIVPSTDPLYPLFKHLYSETKQLYAQMPLRRNGENPFIHPLNVVMNLKKAGVKDVVTLCAGLLHDYIEEKVDIYRDQHKIKEKGLGIKRLDVYEKVVFEELGAMLELFSRKHKIKIKVVDELIAVLRLLTRHKRDFYYKSIIGIFECRDEKVREKAIQVKLADRTHNIWSIENFTEHQRLFQCFKNLFILNNVKLYLIERRERKLTKGIEPLEKLFKKCGKATYDAFIYVCYRSLEKGIDTVSSMIQLAFKKFVLERSGLWEVTAVNVKEKHPLRLFQGIVRKYDARLHHHWTQFEKMKENERKYCDNFFVDFKFTDEQIQAIIDYKDAYSLKDVVAYLMYFPEYTIGLFSYKKLFRKAV